VFAPWDGVPVESDPAPEPPPRFELDRRERVPGAYVPGSAVEGDATPEPEKPRRSIMDRIFRR
jgi:hypothetical protein